VYNLALHYLLKETPAGVDPLVAHSNELCNALGLDTISTGGTITWALECAERGLITEEDTGGIPPSEVAGASIDDQLWPLDWQIESDSVITLVTLVGGD
jgi:hypothetical protein